MTRIANCQHGHSGWWDFRYLAQCVQLNSCHVSIQYTFMKYEMVQSLTFYLHGWFRNELDGIKHLFLGPTDLPNSQGLWTMSWEEANYILWAVSFYFNKPSCKFYLSSTSAFLKAKKGIPLTEQWLYCANIHSSNPAHPCPLLSLPPSPPPTAGQQSQSTSVVDIFSFNTIP